MIKNLNFYNGYYEPYRKCQKSSNFNIFRMVRIHRIDSDEVDHNLVLARNWKKMKILFLLHPVTVLSTEQCTENTFKVNGTDFSVYRRENFLAHLSWKLLSSFFQRLSILLLWKDIY